MRGRWRDKSMTSRHEQLMHFRDKQVWMWQAFLSIFGTAWNKTPLLGWFWHACFCFWRVIVGGYFPWKIIHILLQFSNEHSLYLLPGIYLTFHLIPGWSFQQFCPHYDNSKLKWWNIFMDPRLMFVQTASIYFLSNFLK